jgi:hypothetical protein
MFQERHHRTTARDDEVARFWRPFRLLGSSQHRGSVASQLDPEQALSGTKTIESISPRSISDRIESAIPIEAPVRHRHVTRAWPA